MRRSATFWIWPVHAVVLNSQTRSWAQSSSTFAKLETPFFGSRGPKTGFFSGHSRIFCARTKFQLTSLALLSNLYCYINQSGELKIIYLQLFLFFFHGFIEGFFMFGVVLFNETGYNSSKPSRFAQSSRIVSLSWSCKKWTVNILINTVHVFLLN